MKKLVLVLITFLTSACALPYIKVSSEISTKYCIWPSGINRYVEVRVLNTGKKPLKLKIFCNIQGKKVYKIKLKPGQEKRLSIIKVAMPFAGGQIPIECRFYKIQKARLLRGYFKP